MSKPQADSQERLKKKARDVRYRKAICYELNWDSITNTLDEIESSAADIQWTDAEEIIEQAIGDEEEAYEFKMAFSSLAADCERMRDDLEDWRFDSMEERFNNFFAAAHPDGEKMLGWDEYEGDYMGISGIETDWAVQEAVKRLERMTKKEIIENAHWAMSVAINYLSIKTRYDQLKDTLDLINGNQKAQIQTVKEIQRLYEAAQGKDEWDSDMIIYDRFLRNLDPYDRMWIE